MPGFVYKYDSWEKLTKFYFYPGIPDFRKFLVFANYSLTHYNIFKESLYVTLDAMNPNAIKLLNDSEITGSK